MQFSRDAYPFSTLTNNGSPQPFQIDTRDMHTTAGRKPPAFWACEIVSPNDFFDDLDDGQLADGECMLFGLLGLFVGVVKDISTRKKSKEPQCCPKRATKVWQYCCMR